MDECIFCKIIKGEISSKKIYESDNFLCIWDLNQIAAGHVLIISKKHFQNILEIPDILSEDLLRTIKKTFLLLVKQKKAKGFNVVINNYKIAGQLIPHFHAHIILRKEQGDFKEII